MFSAILDDEIYPTEVVLHFGVDPRVISIGTADTPGHNTLKFAVTYKRSS